MSVLSIRLDFTPDYVLGHLVDILGKAETIIGAGHRFLDQFNAYNQWAADAEQVLRDPLSRADVNSLITTAP